MNERDYKDHIKTAMSKMTPEQARAFACDCAEHVQPLHADNCLEQMICTARVGAGLEAARTENAWARGVNDEHRWRNVGFAAYYTLLDDPYVAANSVAWFARDAYFDYHQPYSADVWAEEGKWQIEHLP